MENTNSLFIMYPKLVKEWNSERNKSLTPHDVSYGSTKKVWWKCENNHEWEASPNQRTSRNNGCPYCSHRKLLRGFNDLKTTNSNLAEEWHPTKNNGLTPSDVMAGSKKKVWWKCKKCGYEWQASLKARNKGSGCKHCSSRSKELIQGVNDLATVAPELVGQWHVEKNGSLSPSEISSKSSVKVWWLGSCGHEWEASPAERSRGRSCPYCSGRRVLRGYNDLATTNPDLAEQWHPFKNTSLTPYDVTKGSHKEVWWIGVCGHEWQARINSRYNKSYGCPICSQEISTSYPEQAILYELGKIEKAESRSIVKEDEVDIYLPRINCGVEYNGVYWHQGKELSDEEKSLRLKSQLNKLIVVNEKMYGDINVLEDRIFYPINNNYSLLDEVINIIIQLLNLKNENDDIIVNTDADRIYIYEQYIKSIKGKSIAV